MRKRTWACTNLASFTGTKWSSLECNCTIHSTFFFIDSLIGICVKNRKREERERRKREKKEREERERRKRKKKEKEERERRKRKQK
jgi:hypothetical protein